MRKEDIDAIIIHCSAMAVYVKRSGSWVEASDVLAKDNGTWK